MGVASFQSVASGVNLHGVLSASRSAQALYSVRSRSRSICTGGLDPIHHSRRQCPLALSHAPQDSWLLCCALLQATFSPPRNCAVSNDTFSDFWAVMGIPRGGKSRIDFANKKSRLRTAKAFLTCKVTINCFKHLCRGSN